MRRALHEGQSPRPLQEKAIRRSCPHSPHRARAKPWARMPRANKRRERSSERFGATQLRLVGVLVFELVVNRLNAGVLKATSSPEMKEAMHAPGSQSVQRALAEAGDRLGAPTVLPLISAAASPHTRLKGCLRRSNPSLSRHANAIPAAHRTVS